MAQIIVVRHGRTEWNRVEKFRGRADLDLDEIGKKQAKATAERLADWPVSAVFCSPLRRTMTTAEILSEYLKLEVKPLAGLIDIDYGEWQGLSDNEAGIKYEDLYQKWINAPYTVKFPGGESLEEVRARATAAVNEIIKRYPEKAIVLVTHKVICQVIALHFLGLDNSHFWQIQQDVSAVNLFQVTNNAVHAMLINDTCHLTNL